MSIKKYGDFTEHMKTGNILLSADPGGDGTTDGIQEMSVHYMELQPGSEVIPHNHKRAEVYIIMSGRALIMAGDDISEVAKGDVALAPTGTYHGIKVIGSEPLRFYALNSPPSSTCPMVEAPEEILWKWKQS